MFRDIASLGLGAKPLEASCLQKFCIFKKNNKKTACLIHLKLQTVCAIRD